MSLSDVEIAEVVRELAPRLVGGAVGRVHDAGQGALVLEVGKDRVLVSAHPRASRLHLAGNEKPSPQPSGFAMLLRKRLGGLRLQGLTAVPGERVVVFEFGAGKERLVAELSGAHANIILVDELGKIVSTLRSPTGTTRSLAPCGDYTPSPPAPEGARWRGQSRFAVLAAGASLSACIAAHYEELLAREEAAKLREQLGAALRRLLTRALRRTEALRADLARADAATVFRKYGDLLLAHLHEVPKRGAQCVTVSDDFEDGAPLTIALDIALDGKANAARYYKQHKRLAGGRKRIEERLAATLATTDAATARLARLATLDLGDLRTQLAAMPEVLRGRQPLPRIRRDDAPSLPYREFRSTSGAVILVGRRAADNDRLTFTIARGSDVWLHTRDAPGAHVIVRVDKGAGGVSEATLTEAALLAAHFSPLARETQVDVTWTHVKHLRKPKGAAPGLVYVTEAKTIRVRMDEDRLARLMAAPDPLGIPEG